MTATQVILLERIETLGQMGDVVKVRPGFARNYLLPQNKALRATKQNLELFEQQRAQLETENLKRREEAAGVAAKIDGMQVVIIRQAGDSGQLYGSVSARDIAEAVTAAGATVARGQIVLDRPIKTLGLHPVRVRLHPEVSVTVSANVARSEADAERQAQTGEMVTLDQQRAAEDAAEAAERAAAMAEIAEEQAAEATALDEREI